MFVPSGDGGNVRFRVYKSKKMWYKCFMGTIKKAHQYGVMC